MQTTYDTTCRSFGKSLKWNMTVGWGDERFTWRALCYVKKKREDVVSQGLREESLVWSGKNEWFVIDIISD